MKAIILAAGFGSRMYPLMQDTPKCLLDINGETIMLRQLNILKSCGIKDIIVVTGFRHEKIVKLYGKRILTRYNPHYEITNNMFSLWTVRDLFDDDFLIVNSDVVCTKELVEKLLSNNDVFCLSVSTKLADEDEVKGKVRISGDSIICYYETRWIFGQSDMPEGTTGEAIGVVKVKKEGVDILNEAMFECLKKDSQLGVQSVFGVIAGKGHKVGHVLIDTPWIEIDTAEDYEKARRIF